MSVDSEEVIVKVAISHVCSTRNLSFDKWGKNVNKNIAENMGEMHVFMLLCCSDTLASILCGVIAIQNVLPL